MNENQKTITLNYTEFKEMETELERLKHVEKSKSITVYVRYCNGLFTFPREEEYSIDISSGVEGQIKDIFLKEASSIAQRMQRLINAKEELIQISKLNRFNAFFNWTEICEKISSLPKKL